VSLDGGTRRSNLAMVNELMVSELMIFLVSTT